MLYELTNGQVIRRPYHVEYRRKGETGAWTRILYSTYSTAERAQGWITDNVRPVSAYDHRVVRHDS